MSIFLLKWRHKIQSISDMLNIIILHKETNNEHFYHNIQYTTNQWNRGLKQTDKSQQNIHFSL